MSDVCSLNTSIEVLPNELWWSIFTYLSPIDRLFSFGNLNSRLNGVLRNAGVGIDDTLVLDPIILREFLPYVVFVKLEHRCNNLDLSRLVNVRSLTMLHMLYHQTTATDPIYLLHLTHLHLSSPSDASDDRYGRLLELILHQYFQSLVSINLPRAHFFGNYTNAGNSKLLNITIGSCRSDRFETLLSLVPNVRYLKILHLINWPITMKTIHNKINYLEIHSETRYIDEQDTIAVYTALPSLRYFEILELNEQKSRCLPLSSYGTTIF